MSVLRVRLVAGGLQALSDRQIEILLDQHGNVHSAAAAACEIVALSAEKPDVWMAAAKRLRSQVGTVDAAPIAGGLTVSGKDTNESDTDRVSPRFTRELHEND